MNYSEFDSFSVCFNMLKLKYRDYDESLTKLNFLSPNDKVNVFINFETVLKLLSTVKDIDKKIYSAKDFTELMVSNMVNLCAHYRRFFRGNGLQTRVFLYFTDIETQSFNESEILEDYRSYYNVKYMRNPRFVLLGDALVNDIIPMVKTITTFIPGVYAIPAKGIEGSLVPYIISREDPEWRNLIITGDMVDTQYMYDETFVCHYLRRSPLNSSVSCTISDLLINTLKKPNNDYTVENEMYKNKSFYILLLSVLGEKYRSIEGIDNIGNASLLKILSEGIQNYKITQSTMHIELLSKLFPDNIQKDIIRNFNCLDIHTMCDSLSKDQKFSILSQMEDRVDNNSLLKLNGKDFYKHPLMLEELTM